MFDVKGTLPEWELIYNLLAEAEPGQTVTFAELDEALGRDFREQRSPIDKARKVLEREHKRSLQNVRGVGYRVVEGDGQVDLASNRSKRARRQIGKGLHTSRNTDRNTLSEAGRERADRIERRMEFAEERLTRIEARQKRTEVRVDDLAERQHETELTVKRDKDEVTDRVARLEEQLARFVGDGRNEEPGE